jgi:hypothetical protein
MAVQRWTFTDPVTSAVYTFEVNPNEGGSPQYKKTISSQSTVAPGGAVILFEGADEPRTGSFSGSILSLGQYQAMTTWFSKRYPIVMQDDLNREQTIYITEFAPKRQRSALYPYKHTFTVNYIVLESSDL